MATIQIRDIPDAVHEDLQQQARKAGQSLQADMQRLETLLDEDGDVELTAEQIVEHLHADRR